MRIRKRINDLMGRSADEMVHENAIVDEMLAYQEYLILMLESLMVRCSGPIRAVLFLAAIAVVTICTVCELIVSVVVAVVVAGGSFFSYLEDGCLLFAVAMIPIGFILTLPMLVAMIAFSYPAALKSIWQSLQERQLIFESM
mgnify:CR=1 FL=1